MLDAVQTRPRCALRLRARPGRRAPCPELPAALAPRGRIPPLWRRGGASFSPPAVQPGWARTR